MPAPLAVAAILLAVLASGVFALVRWGIHWGATRAERTERMPGDEYFAAGPPARVAMTRAVSIRAAPESVWPWLAQLGRGAGFYSLDRLDNGGRTSARHVVSWVPPPRLGDAGAIGYLRRLVPGRELTWWLPGSRFLGAHARAAADVRLRPQGAGSRLVIRMSADAAGLMAWPALGSFVLIDSVMAATQIARIQQRVERHGARASDSERPETGARDQYQLYEVIYASGEAAGVPGREQAALWRRAALAAGVVDEEPP